MKNKILNFVEPNVFLYERCYIEDVTVKDKIFSFKDCVCNNLALSGEGDYSLSSLIVLGTAVIRGVSCNWKTMYFCRHLDYTFFTNKKVKIVSLFTSCFIDCNRVEVTAPCSVKIFIKLNDEKGIKVVRLTRCMSEKVVLYTEVRLGDPSKKVIKILDSCFNQLTFYKIFLGGVSFSSHNSKIKQVLLKEVEITPKFVKDLWDAGVEEVTAENSLNIFYLENSPKWEYIFSGVFKRRDS